MEPWSQFDFPRMTSVLKKTTGSYYGSSHVTPLDREVQISVADDLSGSVIGLMPTQEFLDRYVPTSREPLTDVDPNFFDEIPTSGLETDRYPHFVSLHLPQILESRLLMIILIGEDHEGVWPFPWP